MERTTDHYGSRKYKIQDTKYMSQKLRETRRVQLMKIDHWKPIDIINIIDKNQSINIDWFH